MAQIRSVTVAGVSPGATSASISGWRRSRAGGPVLERLQPRSEAAERRHQAFAPRSRLRIRVS